MKMLLLLLVHSVLSLVGVHCSVSFPSDPLLSSSGAIENYESDVKKTKGKTELYSQLTFDLKNDQQKQTNLFKLNSSLDFTEKLELRFERKPPHLFPGSNISSSLSIFNLNKNSPYDLSVSIFDGLKKSMTSLMKHNNLNSLNATIFLNSRSLVTLKIGMNNLITLPQGSFRDLTDLTTVSLSANSLRNLPRDFCVHNRKLKMIELTENEVRIDIPSTIFTNCPDLEVVRLQRICPQQVSEDLFWNSYELKEIDLSKNHLLYIPYNLLKMNRKLRFLDLSFNYLSRLSDKLFSATNKLYELNLSNNYLKTLSSPDLFAGLHNLAILNMDNNDLQMIHANVFAPLSNLTVARFAHNFLNLSTDLHNRQSQSSRDSPFHHCRYLEVLDLSYNHVSQMFSDWTVNHTRLLELDLSYNNFSYLESNDLLFNSSNLSVNLTHNHITMVNLTRTKQVRKIKTDSTRNVSVDLNANPINCYCDVDSLIRYVSGLTHSLIADFIKPEDLNYVRLKVDQLKCNAPENFRGTLLKELCYDELTCSVNSGRSAACASGGACNCQNKPQDAVLQLSCDGKNLTKTPVWINLWNIESASVYCNVHI